VVRIVRQDADLDHRALRGCRTRGARLSLRSTRARALLHEVNRACASIRVPIVIYGGVVEVDHDEERLQASPSSAAGCMTRVAWGLHRASASAQLAPLLLGARQLLPLPTRLPGVTRNSEPLAGSLRLPAAGEGQRGKILWPSAVFLGPYRAWHVMILPRSTQSMGSPVFTPYGQNIQTCCSLTGYVSPTLCASP
jgi:hypothetical protein